MNYLALLNAALITDLFVLLLLINGAMSAKILKIWYIKFGLGAFMADVLSLMIGFLIAHFIYPFIFTKYNFFYFLVVIVGVQMTHDLLFGLFINQYKGKSEILNVFKKYASDLGVWILIGDAAMMILTTILQKVLAPYNNIVLTIILLYLTPYFLFSVSM
jgi:hypothetical protein